MDDAIICNSCELTQLFFNWFRSFKPFYELLGCSNKPQIQKWAVWAIHHVCTLCSKLISYINTCLSRWFYVFCLWYKLREISYRTLLFNLLTSFSFVENLYKNLMDEKTLDLLQRVYRQSPSNKHVKVRITEIIKALGRTSLLAKLDEMCMEFEEAPNQIMDVETDWSSAAQLNIF